MVNADRIHAPVTKHFVSHSHVVFEVATSRCEGVAKWGIEEGVWGGRVDGGS